MRSVCNDLRFESVGVKEYLIFNWYEFSFFRNSEQNKAFIFRVPSSLAFFVAVPYLASLEIILFKARRYFVKFKDQTVGLFATEQDENCLHISTLAVAPEARRRGVATCMLDYSKRLAEKTSTTSIELSVLKTNIPAQKLYVKYGFRKKTENRMSLILQRRIGKAKS